MSNPGATKPPVSGEVQSVLLPQESMLEVELKGKNLYIGIPKETSFQENRIALVPEAVRLLTNNGHRILIEAGAGNNSSFADADYSESGAHIVYSTKEVYQADLILKVAPPSPEEQELMQQKQTLISILQIAMQDREFINRLTSKKITALAYEYIRDNSGALPVIQTLSEIVGSTSILVAAEYLSNTFSGRGEILGGITGIPPTEIVVFGAGVVGEYAARAAMGLGARVKVFDDSLYKLRRLQQNLGTRIYTSTLNPSHIRKALLSADVVIGALAARNGRTPIVVTEEMVSQMKNGSVIIDVSIDQGGCFETSEVTSHTNPVFRKYGVIHYCVPNIASRVSRTASYALSNIFSPILLSIGEEGGLDEMLWKEKHIRSGVYMYKGIITNKIVSDVCRLPFRDLNLLMASRL
ncbi:MAG: alanine dehydrogenase [Bacteroidia bacterium]|nr:alanine dehydrogenase [Bacteroidia bacterium]MCZ2277794.1 alanine dehydrogenase [Bacteroidia bacterium]